MYLACISTDLHYTQSVSLSFHYSKLCRLIPEDFHYMITCSRHDISSQIYLYIYDSLFYHESSLLLYCRLRYLLFSNREILSISSVTCATFIEYDWLIFFFKADDRDVFELTWPNGFSIYSLTYTHTLDL